MAISSPQFGSLFLFKIPTSCPKSLTQEEWSEIGTRFGHMLNDWCGPGSDGKPDKAWYFHPTLAIDTYKFCGPTYTVDLSSKVSVTVKPKLEQDTHVYHIISGVQKNTTPNRYKVAQSWVKTPIAILKNLINVLLLKQPTLTQETLADEKLEAEIKRRGLTDFYQKIPFEKAGSPTP